MNYQSIAHYILRGILLFTVPILFMSCVFCSAGVRPPQGILYTNISAPLTLDYDNTPVSGQMVVREQKSTKYIHDIILTGFTVAWDDASIRKIAEESGIDKLYYADYEFTAILGMYAEFKVVLHGTPKK